jgi:hypothetical protein
MSTSAIARISDRRARGAVRRFAARPILVLVLAGMAGCRAGPGPIVDERLDEASGVTVRADARPIVFARTDTRYSRSARDYVFLGPVAVNRQGSREYYLWVGVGTTLDRGYIAPDGDVPVAFVAEVAGEPIELALRSWSEREPKLAATHIYRTTVPLRAELAARVTLSQLELLSRVGVEAVWLAADGGATEVYLRWDDEPIWPGFLATSAAAGR